MHVNAIDPHVGILGDAKQVRYLMNGNPKFRINMPYRDIAIPPAMTWGLIRIQTGMSGYLLPNCSRIERLSILICTPILATDSISLKDTPLGV